MKMPSFSLSRAVAGYEKFLIVVLGAFQAYIAAVDTIQEPEKALYIALLIACQGWLGTNTPPASTNPEDETVNPPKGTTP